MATDKVKELHQKLADRLSGFKLGMAGRILYFDPEQQMFILAMHATRPEMAEEATTFAWNNIPEDLKAELQAANIGFAGKQI